MGTVRRRVNKVQSLIQHPQRALRQLVHTHGLVDVWRRMHTDARQYTWSHLRESRISSARSRFQNIAEMDTPSGFFFGLERKNGQKKSTKRITHCRRSSAVGCLKFSTETNSRLAEPLRLCELQAALQSMQGQRAPGIDGLTVEFYKAFWDILAADILDVFNESLTYGSMPVSCRRAVLTLLPKKGNLQDIKNWRPVSLLCVDYKLLSKALANRLREAMEQVIHRDQTYCVPGRSMVDNVYLIRDVLEVSSSLGIDTGLISLDQEKAFDRVEHNFLWKVMESFGFNAGFIAKIKVLYSDIESVLKINGSLCAPFRVHRGVRQGCALSGMLYALSLEPLLNKIRFQYSRTAFTWF
ncbi:hypothetical protein L3Q82_003259 [Scortum barcoo]|uniref:Uncharacterized protein n=1 Tax=Scortum barcoo TaxID=214431 RepID=A0ACB8VRE3_9TELE|nr:hypothetical protein L3Q82_003259 [Scortum barcoo]